MGFWHNKNRLLKDYSYCVGGKTGFTKKARVIPLHISPGGDPVAYFVKGVVIAVRHEDAENILVTIGEE